MGGEIGITSQQDHGTTVTLLFPEERGFLWIKRTFEYCFADDESGLLEGLSKTLEIEGFNVDTVESGSAAINALQEDAYDLAFLDLKLGDMGRY